jgi:hypothetical protein
MIMEKKNFIVVNHLTPEVEERVWAKVDAFNEGKKDTLIEGNYFISVGAKSAMFTLWRFHNPNNPKFLKPLPMNFKPSHYIKNLADDLESAVDAAIKYLGNSRLTLDIDRDTNVKYNYDEQIFCFGKYKGQLIEKIAESDMNYLIWLSHQDLAMTKKTAIANLENVKAQVECYFDRIREVNRETCKSQYIGSRGDTLRGLNLTINKVFLKVVDEPYMMCPERYIDITATDANDNIVCLSFKEGTKPYVTEKDESGKTIPAYKVGDILNIKSAKIRSTFERLGRKTTALNFVKLV